MPDEAGARGAAAGALAESDSWVVARLDPDFTGEGLRPTRVNLLVVWTRTSLCGWFLCLGQYGLMVTGWDS